MSTIESGRWEFEVRCLYGDYNSRPVDRNLMFGGSSVPARCLQSRPADRNLVFGVSMVIKILGREIGI